MSGDDVPREVAARKAETKGNLPLRRDIVIALFLVLATVVIFEQVRNHEFLSFDDSAYVAKNPYVQAGLTARGLRWAFTTGYASNWHPLTWLSHMLDCELYGLSPGPHHLTNLLFHIATTLLLFLVLRKMIGESWTSGFVAALFALHPLHVESVAWVAERKDVLSTFFWMLTVLAYLRYVERPGFSRYVAVLVSFVLGLLSKPMLVTLPFVLLLLDYWPLGRTKFFHATSENSLPTYSTTQTHKPSNPTPTLPLPLMRLCHKSVHGSTGSPRTDHGTLRINYLAVRPERVEGRAADYDTVSMGRGNRYLPPPSRGRSGGGWGISHPHLPPSKGKGILSDMILEKIPLFVLAAASSVITFFVQQKGGSVGSLEVFPLGARVANALVSYVRYIEKMIWPRNLAVFYPYPDPLPVWQAAGAALLLVCVSVLVIRAARKHPYLLVGWLWYLGTLVPVIGLVKVGLQAMADRYTYVPLIGLFIAVAMGVPDIIPRGRRRTLAFAISAGLLISVLMAVTRSQIRHWRNSVTLYEHALKVTSENSLIHTNLGAALTNQGKYQEAMFHYAEALRIKPDNAHAHYNLGVALAQQGKYQEAMDHLSETLRNNPDDSDARYNLGLTLARHGKYQEAIAHFSEALRINPMDPDVHYNWGLALACQGKDQEAVSHYTSALRINPDFANAHYNLGLALARQGKDQEAVSHYARALRITPRDAGFHHDMGIALARQEKYQEAIAHFLEALRIQPDHGKAHYNLGLALAQQGKNQEARVQYAEALKIDPYDADAHNNLGVSLAHEGKYREAIPRFAEAVRIRPGFGQARFSLALAHLMTGNRNGALEQHRILQKTHPDLASALAKKIQNPPVPPSPKGGSPRGADLMK